MWVDWKITLGHCSSSRPFTVWLDLVILKVELLLLLLCCHSSYYFYSFLLLTLLTSPDCTSEVVTYDLYAIICHHGTAGGGHYTAYCQNWSNHRWYEFDDQYVTEVSSETVAKCEAYVLFYKKTSPEMTSRRQRTVELMQVSVVSVLVNFNGSWK